MSDYRVLVTGSRGWDNEKIIFEALDLALAKHAVTSSHARDDDWTVTIVHGACPEGADLLAHEWYVYRVMTWHERVREEPHRARWALLGAQAGNVRNQEMVDAGADECLAFGVMCRLERCARMPRHVTHGTGDCVKRAEKAGIPVQKFAR